MFGGELSETEIRKMQMINFINNLVFLGPESIKISRNPMKKCVLGKFQ